MLVFWLCSSCACVYEYYKFYEYVVFVFYFFWLFGAYASRWSSSPVQIVLYLLLSEQTISAPPPAYVAKKENFIY